MKKIYTRWFALPAAVLYGILYVAPILAGAWYSLTNWNVTNFDSPKFIGLQNYITIFVKEQSVYLRPITNTLVFAFCTAVAEAALGLALAILLNRKLRTRGLLRGIFFLPGIMAPLIIGYIFSSIYHPSGFINNMLGFFGLESLQHSWLIEPQFAFAAVMSTEVWRYFGLNMIIFTAGLQVIPESYYESAAIDGAGPWKKFTAITFPLIIPSVVINTVLNIIHGINVFDVVFALTNGGPGGLTEVINTVVYTEFGSGRYGLASAMNVVVILLTLVISIAVQAVISRKEVAIS